MWLVKVELGKDGPIEDIWLVRGVNDYEAAKDVVIQWANKYDCKVLSIEDRTIVS